MRIHYHSRYIVVVYNIQTQHLSSNRYLFYNYYHQSQHQLFPPRNHPLACELSSTLYYMSNSDLL